jgi:antitoxin component of MazEF toxin-antitoxin module
MAESSLFTTEVIEEILRVLKHGNSVELKKENNRLVVVEIQRKVKIKTSANG